ncbi:MAG: MFS transporter, partial [Pseudothermotoga sp.]
MSGKTRSAMIFIVLMGFVSLFSDIVYEGARGVAGPFLLQLGAGAAVVAFAAGFGEFAGYVLRLFTGYLVDRTKRYWFFTLLGYSFNL